jgi:hypothetical protein
LFALLSATAALNVFSQGCVFLARNIPRLGKTSEQVSVTPDVVALAKASIALELVMGVLLLVAAFACYLLREMISCWMMRRVQRSSQHLRPNEKR